MFLRTVPYVELDGVESNKLFELSSSLDSIALRCTEKSVHI